MKNDLLQPILSFLKKKTTKNARWPPVHINSRMVTMATADCRTRGSLAMRAVTGFWLRKVSMLARMSAGTDSLAWFIIGGIY